VEKRRHQTIADFAAIAICPSLIVLLIASLVYFLVICLYRGGFSGRIGYIFFMFIVGAVGIARLSIQESRKYALGYAAVLGLATFFVVSSFVTVQGPFAALSPIINGATIALVWFLADRITFDCTVIDEDEDASGQGLLDGLTDDKASGHDEAQHATRKRGRQPGRTVLWLTAAALPIFGIGQIFLPPDEQWQRSAIFALAIYLFAALSLLVATSFLGVRRYLRQRGVDMPTNVSTAWLAGGIAMTALILIVCFLLPQPGQMLANAELPKTLESSDWLKPSSYGWGKESAPPKEGSQSPNSAPPQTPDQKPSDASGSQSKSENSSGEAGGQKRGDKGEGGEKSGGQKKADGEEKKSENKSSSESKEKGDDKGSGEDKQSEAAKQNEAQNQQQQSDGQEPGEKSAAEERPDEKPANEKPSAEKNASEPKTESQTPPPTPPEPTSSFADNLPSISGFLKAIVYLVLIGILVAFAWLQRNEIAKAWAAFLAWLRGESMPEAEQSEEFTKAATLKPTMPFSAFRNPLSRRVEPREAVIVTYQAAEAWWRERGQARKPDETPSEFIRRLKASSKDDHDAMVKLTDAYNRIVYGDDKVGSIDLAAVAAVWKSFAR